MMGHIESGVFVFRAVVEGYTRMGDLLKRGVMHRFMIFCFPFRDSCEIIENEGMIESSGFSPDSLGAILLLLKKDVS